MTFSLILYPHLIAVEVGNVSFYEQGANRLKAPYSKGYQTMA
jgi:hypothetical protein